MSENETLAVTPAPEPEVTAAPEPEVVAQEQQPEEKSATKTFTQEELDAAVSVLARHGEQSRDGADAGHELLFANRMYRQLFGMTGEGHLMLSRSSADSGSDEVLHAGLSRWFELRARDIRWVDGRPVQLQVATDITARREADEQLHRQELKLQHSSRLVTMGEMASSLAHELNQPLTAISNYCMGLSARIRGMKAKGHTPDPDLMLDALQKTSAQAERAFVGDVLFAGSIGRTDFPGSDPAAMYDSLQLLASMPGDTISRS